MNFTELVNANKVRKDLGDVYVVTNVSNVCINTTNGYYLVVNNTGLTSFVVKFSNYYAHNNYTQCAIQNIINVSGYQQENTEYVISFLDEISQQALMPPNATTTLSFHCEYGTTTVNLDENKTIYTFASDRNIDYIYANGIEFKNEIPWKGILRVPLKEKNKILENLMEKLGKEREEVVVIGDTKYALCMFEIAGISIAFNPTDDIANKADYVIKKRDLNELIHIFENY